MSTLSVKRFKILFTSMMMSLVMFGVAVQLDGSQGFVPFACDGTIYYALNNITPGKTQLTTYESSASRFDMIGEPAPRHNSLGFNPIDNFLYSMVSNTTEIYRIGADGNIVSLGLPLGANHPGGELWVSGAFLPDGNYVVARNPGTTADGLIMVIEGLASNRPQIVSVAPFEPSTTDLVYNPVDGLLYSYDNREEFQQFLTVDPFTGDVEFFGPTHDLAEATGGLALADDGTIRAVGKGQGVDAGFYAIYSASLDPASESYGLMTLFDLSVEPSSGSDAASCVY